MRIIITPQFGIGDALMTFPAIEVLKESLPDSRITFFCFNKAVYEIAQKNPYIDEFIFFPLLNSRLNGLFYILRNVSHKYDLSITFYPSNRKEYNIFSLLTFAKLRIGFQYEHNNISELNWLKNKTIMEDPSLHCVEENIKLLKLLGIETDKIPPMKIYLEKEELENGKNFVLSNAKNQKRVGVHTGSSVFKNHKHKRWGKEKFLELINRLEDVSFFLFGTREEMDENQFIMENTKNKNVVIVTGKSIREVASIIANLELFLTNDSGLMHLASALNIPTVAIFGPTNPVWVRPWNRPNKIIRLDLQCSPCFYYSPKPIKCKNKEKYKCLKDISVEMVLNAIKEFI